MLDEYHGNGFVQWAMICAERNVRNGKDRFDFKSLTYANVSREMIASAYLYLVSKRAIDKIAEDDTPILEEIAKEFAPALTGKIRQQYYQATYLMHILVETLKNA